LLGLSRTTTGTSTARTAAAASTAFVTTATAATAAVLVATATLATTAASTTEVTTSATFTTAARAIEATFDLDDLLGLFLGTNARAGLALAYKVVAGIFVLDELGRALEERLVVGAVVGGADLELGHELLEPGGLGLAVLLEGLEALVLLLLALPALAVLLARIVLAASAISAGSSGGITTTRSGSIPRGSRGISTTAAAARPVVGCCLGIGLALGLRELLAVAGVAAPALMELLVAVDNPRRTVAVGPVSTRASTPTTPATAAITTSTTAAAAAFAAAPTRAATARLLAVD
jgi:hypothetical protein